MLALALQVIALQEPSSILLAHLLLKPAIDRLLFLSHVAESTSEVMAWLGCGRNPERKSVCYHRRGSKKSFMLVEVPLRPYYD